MYSSKTELIALVTLVSRIIYNDLIQFQIKHFPLIIPHKTTIENRLHCRNVTAAIKLKIYNQTATHPNISLQTFSIESPGNA